MKRVYFFLATLLGLLSVLPMSGQTITVKAKVPAHWTNTITAWVWETDGDSYDVTPIKEGDWYSYTHTGASFNIIYRNGEDWTDAANQTVDITNIKTNTCFALSQTGAEKAVYTIVDCETGEDITNTDSVFANVLISQSDVELTILNDTLYPWVYDATNACITNSNKGIKYSSATLSLFYKSDYVTEFQVDWLSYNYSYHQPLQLYIDGVLIKTTSSSSYSTPRYYLPAGEHIITFRDSIGNSSSTNNYSRISNLRIYEILPIDTADFVSYSDVDITITNDSIYPWIHNEGTTYITNSNCGFAYTTSTLSLSYKSDYATEFQVDWLSYNYSSHQPLQLYIDGVLTKTTNSSSYSTSRCYLPAGEHVITFRDSIGNATYVENYSRIKNLRIKEIRPLETAVLTENSQPLTFTNDSIFPWTIEDGYIQSTNYGTKNSSSRFSTTFVIDTPSLFSFQTYVQHPNNYTGYNEHYLSININGNRWSNLTDATGYVTKKILLQSGEYTIMWKDTIYNTTTQYKSRIKNIELSSNWVNVELAYAGTLGVEVLYQVDVLNDVVLLRVKGALNSTDWTNIKQMKNLVGLDLSEATITSIPSNAFDGLSWLSHVKLPEGITSIGEYAFRGTQIWKIDIPATVTSIGQYAFASTRLEEINFPENSQLKTIGYQAFYQCTALREFIMPNTVTSLGTYSSTSEASTFYGCTNLTKLHFSESLTNLRNYTCYGCTALKDVVLSTKVTTIGDYAFYNNTNLHTIDFPETLRTIGYRTFCQCGLDSVKLPIELSTLGEYAFSNCDNLKYIELPSYIGSYDDNFYDCDAVDRVVCKSATPPTISQDPFRDGRSKSYITLVVPSFAVAAYKLDTYWYQFGTIEEGDDIDYWLINGDLMLTNNRRMNGKPTIDISWNGRLTVGGTAPFPIKTLGISISASGSSALLNTCEEMNADSVYSVYGLDERDKWYFISPLYDIDLSRVTHSANGQFVFRHYNAANRAQNGTGSSWQNVTESVLKHGQGYIVRSNSTGVLSLPAVDSVVGKQIFYTDDVALPLEAHVAESAANENWNYVGNPYPAYFDIWYMDFTAPITVWTGSTYKAYSIADDNYALRPMQGFFVQKPEAVDEIIFHKEGRQVTAQITHPANLPQRTTSQTQNRKIYNLSITSASNMMDETRVVINPTASLSYEFTRDAAKFMSMDLQCPQIYTIDVDANRLAINERPLDEAKVVLGYYAATTGVYTIASTGTEGLYIQDNYTGQTYNLSESDYSFTVEEIGENDNRFILIFKNKDNTPTAIDNINSSMLVHGVTGGITIEHATENIYVYTIDGCLVAQSPANDFISFVLPAGMYIVESGNTTTKQVVY